VKIVKGFLILRSSRIINCLPQKSSDDLSIMASKSEQLSSIKAVSHAVLGNVLAKRHLSISSFSDFDDSQIDIDESIIKLFVQHKTIVRVIAEIEEKIKSSIAKNNSIRAEEQRKEAKKAKLTTLIAQRTIGVVNKN
jgi:hypothetical protein